MNNAAPENTAALQEKIAELEQQLKLSDEGASHLAERCLSLEQKVQSYLAAHPQREMHTDSPTLLQPLLYYDAGFGFSEKDTLTAPDCTTDELTGAVTATFELPVAVDIEDEVQKPLGKAALTNLTAYMLSTVESWGVYALLYTGLWFGSTFLYMGGAALKPYDVWLAAYRKEKPEPGWPFGMWQYTSAARVPGVSTNVDMSHAYKDYAAIIKRAGLGAVKGAEK